MAACSYLCFPQLLFSSPLMALTGAVWFLSFLGQTRQLLGWQRKLPEGCSLPGWHHSPFVLWTPDPCSGDTPVLPAHTAPSAMTSAVPRPWSHLLAALFGAEGTPRARSDLCAPRPQSWRAPHLSGVAFASDECQRCPASRTSTAWGAPPLLTPPSEDEGCPWVPGWAAGTSLQDQPPLTSS